jgi:hypothetical protein
MGMLAEIADACAIVTAAENAGAIKSAQGPRALADYSLADCPRLDVILYRAGSEHDARSKIFPCWSG